MKSRPDNLSTDSHLSEILSRLQLTVNETIEKNEKYLLLKCSDQKNKTFVLKYSHCGLKQACKSIHNEAVLTKNLKSVKPLRLLTYYAHGQNFVATEFENGQLLLPNSQYREELRKMVADALINFQLLRINPREIGVEQRTGVRMFYLKGMLKHLLHLWPDLIGLSDSLKCFWILLSGLPLIGRVRVICHGDLLPTNLIYKAAEKEIVFTDLEGFLSENHPLYDVLSYCTIDDAAIWKWNWQKRFIEYYLERTKGVFHFDRNAGEFRKVLRALLVFLLVYRLNESRVNLEGTTYFDGLAKLEYVLRKVRRLLGRAFFRVSAGIPHEKLATRRENLKTVLSKNLFTRHVTWLLDVHRVHG